MSTELNSIEPDAGLTRPETALSRVVFPEPLGPIRPYRMPVSRRRLTPSTAITPPNRTVRSAMLSRLVIDAARRATAHHPLPDVAPRACSSDGEPWPG